VLLALCRAFHVRRRLPIHKGRHHSRLSVMPKSACAARHHVSLRALDPTLRPQADERISASKRSSIPCTLGVFGLTMGFEVSMKGRRRSDPRLHPNLPTKAMPPWGCTSDAVCADEGRRVHYGPQRARTPDPCALFPCKPTVFRGPPEGAMIAIVDPQASRRRGGGRRPCPRCGSTSCSRDKKGRRVHGGPQRARTPDPPAPFSPANQLFSGGRRKGP
jgi:hypothetical protein